MANHPDLESCGLRHETQPSTLLTRSAWLRNCADTPTCVTVSLIQARFGVTDGVINTADSGGRFTTDSATKSC